MKTSFILMFFLIQVPSFLKMTMCYMFRSSARTLVRTRTIPNSKDRVLQWHIQLSFKIAVFHWATNIYCTQFRWIFICIIIDLHLITLICAKLLSISSYITIKMYFFYCIQRGGVACGEVSETWYRSICFWNKIQLFPPIF
jgi:hypothetical protein